MVCKRSLYCWKNGPCANEQTRKQIWEDNIRFRKSLRDINQSDHYWSFQISKNRCLCLESEEVFCERPLPRKYRSASLQRLHDIDCVSVTHDYNGLKFRNCYIHCPNHEESTNIKEIKRADTPIPKSLAKREPLTFVKYTPKVLKPEEKNEFCHRYKNTLTLKPSMKTKFLSQTNLTTLDDKNLKKKSFHASYDNLSVMNKRNIEEFTLNELPKKVKSKTDSDVQTDPVTKKLKSVKNPKEKHSHMYTPISRTTRRMLHENKQVPFMTYGCNNNNLDIGSKRTHNVLASKLEVYPNALTAKQQKRDLIMKYMQSEKEFQNKCLPEELRRKINHSSLWSLDTNKKDKSVQKKSSKYLPPIMTKPPKKVTGLPSQFDSGYYRNYRKPQIHFY